LLGEAVCKAEGKPFDVLIPKFLEGDLRLVNTRIDANSEDMLSEYLYIYQHDESL